MKIEITTLKTLPNRALNNVNKLGGETISFLKQKSDSFTNSNLIKNCPIKKETFVGSAIIAAAVAATGRMLLSVKNKLDEQKNF